MAEKITPQIPKGFRDFLPSDVVKRQYAVKIIQDTFKLFGFVPLQTPTLEYLATFSGNIGEDEKLFFKFIDQGDRQVALPYDNTVPACRVIAQYPNEIKLPFKRYQIQNVFRSEKPQKGRYREFLQCDADIFGVDSRLADAEMIALSLTIFKNLGFKKPIALINDRALYTDIKYDAIVAIDKLSKIGLGGVISELTRKGYDPQTAREMVNQVKNNQPNDELKFIFNYLDNAGFKENYRFEPTLARSFSYSTGTIWEIIDENFGSGSLLGGERFDSLVSRFTNREVSGVGFAVGFDRTVLAMEELNLFPPLKIGAQVMVAIFNEQTLNESVVLARQLRSLNIQTDLYPNPVAKLDKQFKYASELGIPFVAIIGDEEIKNKTVSIKNMTTGKQESLPYDEKTLARVLLPTD